MNKLKKTSVTALGMGFLLAFVSCSKSTSGYPDQPKEVLNAFLQADAQAAGLSTSTWPEVALYTTWKKAPSWDKFVVISGYEVGDVRTASTRAQIPVTYHKLGSMSATFVPGPGVEQVTFYLNKVDGQWKVDLPELAPHVTADVIRRRLNAASTTDPKTKAANDALISQIGAVEQRR